MVNSEKKYRNEESSAPLEKFSPAIKEFMSQANKVILGKEREIRLTLCCLLAGGHILIEDLPGMGKTTLVKLFAKLLNLDFNRVQFTSDLLPADILGIYVYEEEEQRFSFHPGPIFSQLVLGDELNRASPKTQSACLQAMEEHEVSVDGTTHALPKPFFFIGTQNPRHSIGTFPLPGSQLDRFLMRIELGYPSQIAEKDLLFGESRSRLLEKLSPVIDGYALLEMQAFIEKIYASDPLIEYLLELIRRSRSQISGLSPRAGLDWLQAARSWAFLEGRSYVIPEDVQAVGVSVMSHRLGQEESGVNGKSLAQELIESVPVR